MVVKFTFQSVFGNSLQNPRHFSARGREESLELYSILWSDWPTSKQEVLRHGNRFAARVRRRYFSEGEKRRPEMRLLFAGYTLSQLRAVSQIKSIPNFLLFFQFLLGLLGDLSVRSAWNFVERRMRSTIYDSLFWVIYELVIDTMKA